MGVRPFARPPRARYKAGTLSRTPAMTASPATDRVAPEAETLGDLRVEIDRIDAAMHESLIARGAIIDRLIAVKARAGGGSAFRPDRESSMMRHIAERHRGRLPLDTVEGIWRIIISTFTHVQAAYAVHADASAGDAAMRDSARFHFGFTVPLRVHDGATAVIAAVQQARTDLGLVRLHGGIGAGAWWRGLAGPDAPKIIARLPFVERPDHPAGMPVFVLAMPSAATPATEVVVHSLWVDRWRDDIPAAVAALGGEILEQAADDDGLALLVALPGGSAPPGDSAMGEGSARRLRDRLVTDAGDTRVAWIGSHAARYDFRGPAVPNAG